MAAMVTVVVVHQMVEYGIERFFLLWRIKMGSLRSLIDEDEISSLFVKDDDRNNTVGSGEIILDEITHWKGWLIFYLAMVLGGNTIG